MAKTLLQDLSSVATFKSGGTPSKQRPEYWGGELPWISGKDFRGFEASSSKDTLSASGAAVASKVPEGSTLVLVRGMILARRVPVMYTTREVAINQDVRALVPKSEILPRYLAYAIHARAPQLQRFVTYAGHGTGRLESDYLKSLPIWVPNLEEQQQIIEHIGRFDEAISSLRRLLKLRKVHLRGLMQQLLTGRRLPAFAGEAWESTPLSCFLEPTSEANSSMVTDRVLSCTKLYGIIAQQERFKQRIASADVSHYKVVRHTDLVFDPMLLWDASIGFVEKYDIGVVSPAYTTFRFTKAENDRRYIRWMLRSHRARHIYKVISQGTNQRRRKAPTQAFLKSEFEMPTSADERAAIADILDTAQREIKLLEQLREQVQLQKRGLMQKLLTGEIRVPNEVLAEQEVRS